MVSLWALSFYKRSSTLVTKPYIIILILLFAACNGLMHFLQLITYCHYFYHFVATFDVYDLNVITTGNAYLSYTVAFPSGSNALGVLIILLHRTNGLTDFNQSIYFVQERTGAEGMNQLSGILAGNYIALAYDVEENGEITSN